MAKGRPSPRVPGGAAPPSAAAVNSDRDRIIDAALSLHRP